MWVYYLELLLPYCGPCADVHQHCPMVLYALVKGQLQGGGDLEVRGMKYCIYWFFTPHVGMGLGVPPMLVHHLLQPHS